MNDDYLRKHHIQVSDWAWKTAQELFGMKSPSSRMSDLLDWALRYHREQKKLSELSNQPVPHNNNQPPAADPGTIITATRQTICQYFDKKTGETCGGIIDVGEKMVYYTGTDNRKKSEHLRHRMGEE